VAVGLIKLLVDNLGHPFIAVNFSAFDLRAEVRQDQIQDLKISRFQDFKISRFQDFKIPDPPSRGSDYKDSSPRACYRNNSSSPY